MLLDDFPRVTKSLPSAYEPPWPVFVISNWVLQNPMAILPFPHWLDYYILKARNHARLSLHHVTRAASFQLFLPLLMIKSI